MKDAFHDLSPELFPFTIEYRHGESDELLHTEVVDGPGVLHTWSYQPTPVRVVVKWGNGDVSAHPPY